MSVDLYASILRPLAFRLDPEKAHNLAMSLIQKSLIPGRSTPLEKDPVDLFGVHFPNRIGLAAGLDKNAVALDQWHKFGFGYVEIGTITWHPQPGNDKPRMFRLPSDKALINRMGFNNHGAIAVAERLSNSASRIPVGINLGKSKITPLEEAHEDYKKSYEALQSFGDYFVVNVSSPNTPGLRSLQDADSLRRIFQTLREVNDKRPLFVKVAPDLEDEAIDDVLKVAVEANLTGIIATNTTISRDMLPGLAAPTSRHISNSLLGGGLSGTNGINRNITANQQGGLSGAPLLQRSNEVLARLKSNAPDGLVLIGVGGIFSAEDYKSKREIGADLVQLYTGWIYGGPALVPKILN
jgi:dihydroorotate dehydrogenase